MERTFGMDATDFAFAQLATTIIGAIYALVLYVRSNNEKRNEFVLSIYNILYNDAEITKVLYAADKQIGLEELGNKIAPDPKGKVSNLEKETDKTLRFLNLIGGRLKKGYVPSNDLKSFRYEILVVLKDYNIVKYINYLKTQEIYFEYLNDLKYILDRG